LHTSALELGESTLQYITSKTIESGARTQDTQRLRAIADLSFDLLSQIQKMEKLHKLHQLSGKEESEYHSTLRLVGVMLHILNEYHYQDREMMDALSKRYNKHSGTTHNAAA
jgi:predicted protein tyrosine phosphatase